MAVPPLSKTARWYAGDFHVHSRESGDADPTLDEIATFARGRRLDFVELSDHNTVSHLDFIGAAQAKSANVLFLPGVEFTTYAGHANGIGATKHVDHLFGIDGWTFESAAQAFADQDAVFAINHPMLDLGTTCIGCAWKQKLPKAQLGAVEIGTGGWNVTGLLFTREAIAYWSRLVGQGLHLAPIGGSDDHSAGQVKLVQNGTAVKTFEVDADPFTGKLALTAPAEGADFWRAEVWVDGQPRTVTGHLWHAKAPEVSRPPMGCSASAPGPLLLALLLGLRRRR